MLRGQRVNAWLDERDCADLVLELAPNTETGYKYVKKRGDKFQAFVYDEKEKRTRNLPMLYETAEKAAKARAFFIKMNLELPPPRPHAPRGSKGAPPKPDPACASPRLPSHGLLARGVRSRCGSIGRAEEVLAGAGSGRLDGGAGRACGGQCGCSWGGGTAGHGVGGGTHGCHSRESGEEW